MSVEEESGKLVQDMAPVVLERRFEKLLGDVGRFRAEVNRFEPTRER